MCQIRSDDNTTFGKLVTRIHNHLLSENVFENILHKWMSTISGRQEMSKYLLSEEEEEGKFETNKSNEYSLKPSSDSEFKSYLTMQFQSIIRLGLGITNKTDSKCESKVDVNKPITVGTKSPIISSLGVGSESSTSIDDNMISLTTATNTTTTTTTRETATLPMVLSSDSYLNNLRLPTMKDALTSDTSATLSLK
jgi:hypothetical protein